MQTCPALVKLDQKSCSATFSTSASGSTMDASLPPNSSVMRFKSCDAPSIIFLPVAVEPVKVILSISAWPVISGPRLSSPVMILTTPAGTTSLISSAKRKVVSGVKGEGFNTIVQPAINAGTIFCTAIITGKFHGTMPPTTPTGTRRVRDRRVSLSSLISSSNVNVDCAAEMAAAPPISCCACAWGLPCSAVSRRNNSS